MAKIQKQLKFNLNKEKQKNLMERNICLKNQSLEIFRWLKHGEQMKKAIFNLEKQLGTLIKMWQKQARYA